MGGEAIFRTKLGRKELQILQEARARMKRLDEALRKIGTEERHPPLDRLPDPVPSLPVLNLTSLVKR